MIEGFGYFARCLEHETEPVYLRGARAGTVPAEQEPRLGYAQG